METLSRNSLERVPLLCTLPPQIPSHSGLALSWALTNPLFSFAVTYIGVFPWPDYIPSTNGMTGYGFVRAELCLSGCVLTTCHLNAYESGSSV